MIFLRKLYSDRHVALWLIWSQQATNQHTKTTCGSTHNQQILKEIEKAISFSTAPKITIFRNKFTKKVKDLYIENHNTLMKEAEKDTQKNGKISCYWTGRIHIVITSI